jgi:two-component system response regulator FlrC
MRLMIIGTLSGQIGEATKIAMDRGAKVAHCETIEVAMSSLRSGQGADLIMADVKLDIAALITQLEKERIVVPVVACGVDADAAAAVAAIRAGAKEYVPLPAEADLIAAILEAVAQESNDVIYRDPVMAKVFRLADQVAASEASILITGESGTGKEVMATYIHLGSNRSGRSFVSVNCAAIPEALLESELFGHEKGAFTGAVARRIGKFEESDGGTLLLDEISEMDIRLQAKLLRAVQEREITRVGSNKPVKVNIRIIATSNRNLAQAVKDGTFREDLLYRLNVVNLDLPSLRQRPGDIAALANHFVGKYAKLNMVPLRPISPAAMDMLIQYHWPGNVRELENTIHRSVLLANGDEIAPDAILLQDNNTSVGGVGVVQSGVGGGAGQGGGTDQDTTSTMVGRTVADVERDLIIDTLEHCLGNRTHAANILGISIRTLRNKLKIYNGEGVFVPLPGDARAG